MRRSTKYWALLESIRLIGGASFSSNILRSKEEEREQQCVERAEECAQFAQTEPMQGCSGTLETEQGMPDTMEGLYSAHDLEEDGILSHCANAQGQGQTSREGEGEEEEEEEEEEEWLRGEEAQPAIFVERKSNSLEADLAGRENDIDAYDCLLNTFPPLKVHACSKYYVKWLISSIYMANQEHQAGFLLHAIKTVRFNDTEEKDYINVTKDLKRSAAISPGIQPGDTVTVFHLLRTTTKKRYIPPWRDCLRFFLFNSSPLERFKHVHIKVEENTVQVGSELNDLLDKKTHGSVKQPHVKDGFTFAAFVTEMLSALSNRSVVYPVSLEQITTDSFLLFFHQKHLLWHMQERQICIARTCRCFCISWSPTPQVLIVDQEQSTVHFLVGCRYYGIGLLMEKIKTFGYKAYIIRNKPIMLQNEHKHLTGREDAISMDLDNYKVLCRQYIVVKTNCLEEHRSVLGIQEDTALHMAFSIEIARTKDWGENESGRDALAEYKEIKTAWVKGRDREVIMYVPHSSYFCKRKQFLLAYKKPVSIHTACFSLAQVWEEVSCRKLWFKCLKREKGYIANTIILSVMDEHSGVYIGRCVIPYVETVIVAMHNGKYGILEFLFQVPLCRKLQLDVPNNYILEHSRVLNSMEAEGPAKESVRGRISFLANNWYLKEKLVPDFHEKFMCVEMLTLKHYYPYQTHSACEILAYFPQVRVLKVHFSTELDGFMLHQSIPVTKTMPCFSYLFLTTLVLIDLPGGFLLSDLMHYTNLKRLEIHQYNLLDPYITTPHLRAPFFTEQFFVNVHTREIVLGILPHLEELWISTDSLSVVANISIFRSLLQRRVRTTLVIPNRHAVYRVFRERVTHEKYILEHLLFLELLLQTDVRLVVCSLQEYNGQTTQTDMCIKSGYADVCSKNTFWFGVNEERRAALLQKSIRYIDHLLLTRDVYSQKHLNLKSML
ncbi:hypothetical protein NECID01_0137 [Nematocida sp. AWRm77]|nr:hypothetical protein NECID01_0137 [Nematocida sp. AWRm77]